MRNSKRVGCCDIDPAFPLSFASIRCSINTVNIFFSFLKQHAKLPRSLSRAVDFLVAPWNSRQTRKRKKKKHVCLSYEKISVKAFALPSVLVFAANMILHASQVCMCVRVCRLRRWEIRLKQHRWNQLFSRFERRKRKSHFVCCFTFLFVLFCLSISLYIVAVKLSVTCLLASETRTCNNHPPHLISIGQRRSKGKKKRSEFFWQFFYSFLFLPRCMHLVGGKRNAKKKKRAKL